MKNKQDDFKLQLANMDLGALRNAIQPFSELLMRYDCAIGEVKTKIENLDMELSITHKRNPVESIKTRLKKPLSIIEKLDRLGKERTIENIDECIRDVAGVRVICTFIDDIYLMTKYLTEQDDIKLLEIKDYIKYPKPNGYRSLHLLIEVPVFLSTGKIPTTVEIQIRTVAMDFWASLEHKIRYKKDITDKDIANDRLKACADIIFDLDVEMQSINTY